MKTRAELKEELVQQVSVDLASFEVQRAELIGAHERKLAAFDENIKRLEMKKEAMEKLK
jgi:hypothetical protein